MEQTENPLLSLSSEKQQQIVDLVDNGNIGEIAEKGGMTRRQVLQVAVALGAGATVGGYSVDQIIGEARAAADTSDSDGNVGLPGDRVDVFADGVDVGDAVIGQVGTSTNRSDIYGDSADLNSFSTGEAVIANRPMVSTADETINVDASGGGDYTTIQEAADQLPLLIRHNITVSVASGDYSTEDVNVPPVIANDQNGFLAIEGDEATPSNVTVGSIKLEGVYGKRSRLAGFQYERDHPESDGPSSLQVDAGTAILADSNFNNGDGTADRAVTCYGGTIIAKGSVDFGSNAYNKGVVVKNSGTWVESTTVTGNVNGRAYESQRAKSFTIDAQSTLTSDNQFAVIISTPIQEYDSSVNEVVALYIANDDRRSLRQLDAGNPTYDVSFVGSDSTLDVESFREFHLDSDSAHTFTLPEAPQGTEVICKDLDGNAGTNNLTFDASGSPGTIDNGSTEVISSDYGWRRFIQVNSGTGSGWLVVGSN